MGLSGRITHGIEYIGYIEYIGLLGIGFMQVLYLGRAPRTKETLPDFLKWRRVTRPPLVFRGLTGSQRTPGFWGVTRGPYIHTYKTIIINYILIVFMLVLQKDLYIFTKSLFKATFRLSSQKLPLLRTVSLDSLCT